jgi:hypothetical protein
MISVCQRRRVADRKRFSGASFGKEADQRPWARQQRYGTADNHKCQANVISDAAADVAAGSPSRAYSNHSAVIDATPNVPSAWRSKGEALQAAESCTKALERDLTAKLGLKTEIAFDGKGGALTIHYQTLEQLDELIAKLA